MSEPNIVTFSPPLRSSPADLTAFRKTVTAALDDGADTVRIDLDHIDVLDSPLIASLIAILRSAREHSARVVLCTSRPQITDTLRVTALDKVFTVENPPKRMVA